MNTFLRSTRDFIKIQNCFKLPTSEPYLEESSFIEDPPMTPSSYAPVLSSECDEDENQENVDVSPI